MTQRAIAIAMLCCPLTAALAGSLPASILTQIPAGLAPLTHQRGDLNGDKLVDYLVVVHDKREAAIARSGNPAPRRPLLLFTQAKAGNFTLAARNDHVVMAIDEGGQCDPFPHEGSGLAIKGHYFTVENGVACGAHWTDYITFRYDAVAHDWLFHRRVAERWELNPDESPDSEALKLAHRSASTGRQDGATPLRHYRLNQR